MSNLGVDFDLRLVGGRKFEHYLRAPTRTCTSLPLTADGAGENSINNFLLHPLTGIFDF